MCSIQEGLCVAHIWCALDSQLQSAVLGPHISNISCDKIIAPSQLKLKVSCVHIYVGLELLNTLPDAICAYIIHPVIEILTDLVCPGLFYKHTTIHTP